MANRRGFLAGLTGFVGGTALSAYTPFPERWLSEVDALPAATSETATDRPEPPADSTFDDETRRRAREVGLATREGVVYLQLRAGTGLYVGTGWVIDDEHVVTNGHVVEQGTELTCYTLDGDTLSLEPVRTSRRPDVALLRTADGTPPTLPTGSASDLDGDQPLVQVGHPGAVGNWVVSLGRFSGRTGVFGTGDTLRSTVPTARGNSGSPLVTLDGDVVGLTFASTTRASRFPGTAPEPSDDAVREEFRPESTALHVPVERVTSLVEEWTG
jgi:serine protease Do